MIERQIITGLIVSTEFIQQVLPIWEDRFLVSKTAKKIAQWSLEYYDTYHKAPVETIESIYFEKLRLQEITKEEGEDIEDILSDLSEEYELSFNLKYILDRTGEYFKERHLELHNKQVQDLIEAGDLDTAKSLASSYTGITREISDDLDLSNISSLLKVENAFTSLSEPILKYPGALGDMINNQLTRGAFVGFMASEKRGKSFWLLEMAIRASRQKNRVAFFQAGDMTEGQQVKRTASYLTRKPLQEKYTGETYIPEVDCIKNQLDLCDKEERECDFGPFSDSKWDEKTIRQEISRRKLIEAYKDEGEDYRSCRNCSEFHHRPWGIPWLMKKNIKGVVRMNEAKKKIKEFFVDRKRKFRISTHPNGTLSVQHIQQILQRWEKEDAFSPDVIVIDYADILITNKVKEFRQQQNQIWKDLRALSQEKNCLLVTVTQADAGAYKSNLLKLENFSEDKRKYAHVTAMYGLNQDKEGREKKLGILRINEIVIREGEFDSTTTVTVLQSLNQGRPFIGSYR